MRSEKEEEVCEWEYDEPWDKWDACGHYTFPSLFRGEEKEFEYCPFCGKKIKFIEEEKEND